MARLHLPSIAAHAAEPVRLNVADRLRHVAAAMPGTIAVACPPRGARGYPTKRFGDSGARYATTTFAELDADATQIANGLSAWGVQRGTRLALLVRPGIEFVTLVFALLRAGMVIILVDPGLGRRNLVRCLAEAEPEGFIAIPLAQAARAFLPRRFPRARWNVTVGRRWFWRGKTLVEVRRLGATGSASAAPDQALAEPVAPAVPHLADSSSAPCSPLPAPRSVFHAPRSPLPATLADDPAAVIFTSGSTGPPKGVLYTHRMFDAQVTEIQSTYCIAPDGADLACFPLFALFNAAMGVTTVFPEMDFSRPASADPKKLLAAANDWQVTQAFASPAVWRVLGDYCAQTGERIESLRQVFSCGAPVPAAVIQKTLACVARGAKMHTPYGATECLPVATIEAAEVLGETAARTDEGAGVCVGRKFDSIEWRVIRITDDPIATTDDAQELPPGEIGELIVRGSQASPCYMTRPECNAESKIADDSECGDKQTGRQGDEEKQDATPSPCLNSAWHRMGDVGYLDEQDRFWYCGRKSQRVQTDKGVLFTECVEGVLNSHPSVRRSALVGARRNGTTLPIAWIELQEDCRSVQQYEQVLRDLKQQPFEGYARQMALILRTDNLPVDIRHNSKINREKLAAVAQAKLNSEFTDPEEAFA